MFGVKRRNPLSPAEPGINLSQEDYGLLLGIYEQQLGTREDIMALSREVQKLLESSKQESDILKSMSTSMKALLQQNADMQAKLDRVPVAPEPAMSQEDKDALTELASDMDTAILTAKQAIPQNTPQASGGGAGNTGVASASQGGSPGLSDQASGGGATGQWTEPAPPPQTDTTNPTPGSQPSTSQPPVEGTATPADQSAPAAAPDAGASDSQHAQDAQAAQQAKPLAGTGGA